MSFSLLFEYKHLLNQLKSYSNIPDDLYSSFKHFILLTYQADQQSRFSEPMPWIGLYIALASLFCILAMVADLVHGLRRRKLWFPCKYFTLNAATLTVIAVAVKLPMDLNNSMPGDVDRAAKLGSMAFMCTIMANFLPSLATMDTKELVTNIIALGILVITLVVNVCIQINTGVLSLYITDETTLESIDDVKGLSAYMYMYFHDIVATSYAGLLLLLLIIYACSSLAILKSKQILETKYQARHETALNDLKSRRLTVENLKKHVSNYWIMAETGSPQFMTACSATSSASGVLCASSTGFHVFLSVFTIIFSLKDYKSDYKWSSLVILIIQCLGVILGTIAPLFRCFADLSFKLSIKWIWNHIKILKVEKYWTQKLSDWKQSNIPFSSGSRKCKIIIHNLKILILNICIGFQMTVVVTCKMIGLFFIFYVICVLCCFHCLKWLKALLVALGIWWIKNPEQEQNEDLRRYVLQLQDDMELADRTLKGITKSVNRLIKKAEKRQPKNLMKLLAEFRHFERVERYDIHHVTPLQARGYPDYWSLPLITLTTIAISLPNVQTKSVDRLLSSVSEGLAYTTIVEESLGANTTDRHVSILKAAKMLWLEVEVYHKWLGNKLQKLALPRNTAGQVLQWFKDTSQNKIMEVESTDFGSPNDNSIYLSICANSMYEITETVLLSHQTNIDQVNEEEMFSELTSMIADILASCLTNLPQVIAMKCHESAIEKREAGVYAAAQLLGETTQIINSLQDHELPGLNPDEFAFIDKWRVYLKHPFP